MRNPRRNRQRPRYSAFPADARPAETDHQIRMLINYLTHRTTIYSYCSPNKWTMRGSPVVNETKKAYRIARAILIHGASLGTIGLVLAGSQGAFAQAPA